LISIEKQYWFYVETYVHISFKKKELLLYNSLTGKALEYSGDQNLLSLIKKLRLPKNLQVIPLKDSDLKDPVISQFVSDVRRYFMGDLINMSFSKGKPAQMMPILKIQKDVKHLKSEASRSVGESMMGYLNEISLYLNNECEHRCGICSKGYKQFPCCTSGKNRSRRRELDTAKIKKLVEELKSTSLININILGGDIFKYSKFEEFLAIINPLQAQKTFYSHYLNIFAGSCKLKLLDADTSLLDIHITAPIDKEKLKAALDIVKNTNLKPKWIFVVQDEKEFEEAESVISSLHIDDNDFQPFFNGKNLEFFKENIFTDKDEILDANPKMKDIYASSAVNTLNFGRLTILSNGHIHANVNVSRLGILGKDSIYDIVYKEMYRGKSWRRIRKNVEPCKNCTFEALCPPLSNYNYAIGRNNLCHRSF
jgi:pseudo-rSAM protein